VGNLGTRTAVGTRIAVDTQVLVVVNKWEALVGGRGRSLGRGMGWFEAGKGVVGWFDKEGQRVGVW
jgi:hypothetical protein